MANTYIIKFADKALRTKFYETLRAQANMTNKHIEFGEILPDLIVYDVSEDELKKVDRLARTKARFVADFQHDLFASR